MAVTVSEVFWRSRTEDHPFYFSCKVDREARGLFVTDSGRANPEPLQGAQVARLISLGVSLTHILLLSVLMAVAFWTVCSEDLKTLPSQESWQTRTAVCPGTRVLRSRQLLLGL